MAVRIFILISAVGFSAAAGSAAYAKGGPAAHGARKVTNNGQNLRHHAEGHEEASAAGGSPQGSGVGSTAPSMIDPVHMGVEQLVAISLEMVESLNGPLAPQAREIYRAAMRAPLVELKKHFSAMTHAQFARENNRISGYSRALVDDLRLLEELGEAPDEVEGGPLSLSRYLEVAVSAWMKAFEIPSSQFDKAQNALRPDLIALRKKILQSNDEAVEKQWRVVKAKVTVLAQAKAASGHVMEFGRHAHASVSPVVAR